MWGGPPPPFEPWEDDDPAAPSPFPDLEDPAQAAQVAALFGALGYDTARTGSVVIDCTPPGTP